MQNVAVKVKHEYTLIVVEEDNQLVNLWVRYDRGPIPPFFKFHEENLTFEVYANSP